MHRRSVFHHLLSGVEDRRRRRYKPEMEKDFSAGGCPATEKES